MTQDRSLSPKDEALIRAKFRVEYRYAKPYLEPQHWEGPRESHSEFRERVRTALRKNLSPTELDRYYEDLRTELAMIRAEFAEE